MPRRAKQLNLSPAFTSLTEERLSQLLELESTIEKLNSQEDILNKKVNNLEEQVKEPSLLKNEVQKLADTNALASNVSELLGIREHIINGERIFERPRKQS